MDSFAEKELAVLGFPGTRPGSREAAAALEASALSRILAAAIPALRTLAARIDELERAHTPEIDTSLAGEFDALAKSIGSRVITSSAREVDANTALLASLSNLQGRFN